MTDRLVRDDMTTPESLTPEQAALRNALWVMWSPAGSAAQVEGWISEFVALLNHERSELGLATLDRERTEGLDLGPVCRGNTPDGPCDDEKCMAHDDRERTEGSDTDEFGDPLPPDPHSPDWYDGYGEGQRDGLALAQQRLGERTEGSELRAALEVLPRLWWCGQWGTLNASRYHGNDAPCAGGYCGRVVYVRDADLRAALNRDPS